MVFKTNKISLKRTNLLSRISCSKVCSRGSKGGKTPNAAMNAALQKVVNTQNLSKTPAVLVTQGKIPTKSVYRCPILNKSSVNISFKATKNTNPTPLGKIENFHIDLNPGVTKKVTNLPLETTYQETLKDVEKISSESSLKNVIFDSVENPNRLQFSPQNLPKNLQDVENISLILIQEDFCAIKFLPESDLLDKIQNIKVVVGISTSQAATLEKHIYIGKVNETFVNGDISFFGGSFSSGTIQKDSKGVYHYCVETSNRIIGNSDVKRLQGFSIPTNHIIKDGFTFGLKLVLNQQVLAEAISLVIIESEAPGSVSHIDDPVLLLADVKKRADAVELQRTVLATLSKTMANAENPLFGKGNQGNGGNNGNLPPTTT